jgi:hypothetical protein
VRIRALASYLTGNVARHMTIPWVWERGFGGFVQFRADAGGFSTQRWEVAWPQLDVQITFANRILAEAATRRYRLSGEVIE